MNGFPITSLINQFANALTEQLVRVEPRYKKVRISELKEEVREVVANMLYEYAPTIYKEYRREKASRTQMPMNPSVAQPSEWG